MSRENRTASAGDGAGKRGKKVTLLSLIVIQSAVIV